MFRDDLFSGRTALVTGASSGLGRHFAELLAAHGLRRLVIGARRLERLAETADAARAAAGTREIEIVPVALDVTDEGSVREAVRVASEGGGLDLLVANAGIAAGGLALKSSLADFDRTIATNLRGAWTCAVEAARAMDAGGNAGARGGDIVFTASILGLRVSAGTPAYAVSKAGVVQMTRALATEWARRGIRVNALAPGFFETEMNAGFLGSREGQAMIERIPQRRVGRPSDLDAPFLLLASGASPYLTGVVLPVDGGHSINGL